ncbi:MAG: response regulator [Patescibacteria group bacterium]
MSKIKKILIAEDELPISRALANKLTKEGYEITVAGNGEEAIKAMTANKFDLAIIDLMMPIKDGWAVLEFAKKNKIKTPIVVASNLGQTEDEKSVRELGAVNFFVKANTPISKIVDYIKNYAN